LVKVGKVACILEGVPLGCGVHLTHSLADLRTDKGIVLRIDEQDWECLILDRERDKFLGDAPDAGKEVRLTKASISKLDEIRLKKGVLSSCGDHSLPDKPEVNIV
jgi:hypothetical protein